MNNRFQGWMNMKRAFTLLILSAALAHADTVTVTVTRSLPYHQEITPLVGDCVQR